LFEYKNSFLVFESAIARRPYPFLVSFRIFIQ
jgi:hypothetical protein